MVSRTFVRTKIIKSLVRKSCKTSYPNQQNPEVRKLLRGANAAIGGNRKNDRIDGYNYATDLTKQIGSTAKPIYDYGPAIEYNNWSSYQLVVDEPTTYSDGTTINNWNGKFEGL